MRNLFPLLTGLLSCLLIGCSCNNGSRSQGDKSIAESEKLDETHFSGETADEDSVVWWEESDYGPLIDSANVMVKQMCEHLSDSDYWGESDVRDSLLMNFVYPKPKVVLQYDDNQEKKVAQRVAHIYGDVLEYENCLHNPSRDFFTLYFSKRLQQFLRVMYVNEYHPHASPFTDSQGHEIMHLHEVEVLSVEGDTAMTVAIFGSLYRDGLLMKRMKLKMVYERDDWYIEDLVHYFSFVDFYEHEMEEGGIKVVFF